MNNNDNEYLEEYISEVVEYSRYWYSFVNLHVTNT